MNLKILQHLCKNNFLFGKYLEELKRNETLSASELEELQNQKLQSVIKVCYEGVTYYRELFDRLKLKPDDIKNREDLKKLPLMDKNTLRQHYKELINKKFKGFRFKAFSSGTSGNPSMTLRDFNSIIYENAALWRQLGWAGKNEKSSRAILRGELLFPADKKNPPFWKYRFWSKELSLSIYHMTDAIMTMYADKIMQLKPFDLYAYPSSAYIFANFCRRNKIQLKFQAVFTSSEMLYDFQKQEIEEVFQCRLFDWYGNTERVAAIGHCEYGSYHEMSDYSIVEYIPKNGDEYEIAGTSLNNFVMPLLRYRVGDIVQLNTGFQCGCKRNFPVIGRIIGRYNDCLQFKDGRKIQLMDNIFKGFDSIREAQIVQKNYDHIIVKVVPFPNFTKECEEKIFDRLHQYAGKESMNYEVVRVDAIDRTSNGKRQLIKSLIPR